MYCYHGCGGRTEGTSSASEDAGPTRAEEGVSLFLLLFISFPFLFEWTLCTSDLVSRF